MRTLLLVTMLLTFAHVFAWYYLLVVLAKDILRRTGLSHVIPSLANYCSRTTDSLVSPVVRRLRYIPDLRLRRCIAEAYLLILLLSTNVLVGGLLRVLPEFKEPPRKRPPAAATQPHLSGADHPAPGTMLAAPP